VIWILDKSFKQNGKGDNDPVPNYGTAVWNQGLIEFGKNGFSAAINEAKGTVEILERKVRGNGIKKEYPFSELKAVLATRCIIGKSGFIHPATMSPNFLAEEDKALAKAKEGEDPGYYNDGNFIRTSEDYAEENAGREVVVIEDEIGTISVCSLNGDNLYFFNEGKILSYEKWGKTPPIVEDHPIGMESLKILLFDSYLPGKRFMAEMLKGLKYSVTEVSNVESAVKNIGELGFDLLVVNWNMSDVDVRGFLKTVRKTERGREMPILITTRAETREDVSRLIKNESKMGYMLPYFENTDVLKRAVKNMVGEEMAV
jgi:CheY-like chemotaxis protein